MAARKLRGHTSQLTDLFAVGDGPERAQPTPRGERQDLAVWTELAE